VDGRATASTESELKAGPPPGIKILIAESDGVLADLYTAALDATGWEVEVVVDAPSLLARFQQAVPTVLLLNKVPDANQVTLVGQIRSMPESRGVVIVVLYDSMDHLNLKKLRSLDVQAWLSKTRTTRETLAQTITELVANRPRPADDPDPK
jgi:CheY-like chemotaxis protein